MTPVEAFKAGFLAKCAEDGCSPEEICQRIRKAASVGGAVTGAASAAGGALSGVAKTALPYILTALLAGPPAVGALGGWGLGRMVNDDFDPDEVLKNEELTAYHSAIQDLKASQARKKQHQLAT
jgi:hypothetical protein